MSQEPSCEGCLRSLSEIAHRHGILVAVDNCFCTPILQKPLELGADLVVHSATKYLDGQGRVLHLSHNFRSHEAILD